MTISEREPPRSQTPELDRSVDLYVVSNEPIEQQVVFDNLISSHDDIHDHKLFALPITIRRRIYGTCFPAEPRKISLSPRFATKAVFPDGYFTSPWDILDPVWGGLQAFRQLRRELMIFFWTQYHFHVTLSPFTGNMFSSLSQVWLTAYLDIVQYMTIEMDLTRFGFSALKVAAQYGHDVKKIEHLVVGIVQGLQKRAGKTTMAELNIMCRKYAGFRPYGGSDDATFEYEAGKVTQSESTIGIRTDRVVQYCPDEVHFLCDAVGSLRGILQRSRISGFTVEYTEMLLRSIFASGDKEPEYSPGKQYPWPTVPVHTPYISYHSSIQVRVPDSSGSLQLLLTSTTNFAQDVEDELLKYESSVYSETEGVGTSRTMSATGTLTEHVQRYSECVGPIVGSEGSRCATPISANHSNTVNEQQGSQIRVSYESGRECLDATPAIVPQYAIAPMNHLATMNEQQNFRIRFSPDSGRNLSAVTPTGSDFRCPTPKTLEEMNRLNEEDPAFVRSLEDEAKSVKKPRPKSMIPSPMRKKEEITASGRSSTSMGNHPPEGTVRRYLSFVKKLREPAKGD
jgi:hypothetical protein